MLGNMSSITGPVSQPYTRAIWLPVLALYAVSTLVLSIIALIQPATDDSGATVSRSITGDAVILGVLLSMFLAVFVVLKYLPLAVVTGSRIRNLGDSSVPRAIAYYRRSLFQTIGIDIVLLVAPYLLISVSGWGSGTDGGFGVGIFYGSYVIAILMVTTLTAPMLLAERLRQLR
ncbi:MAG: hypothetical protein WCB49_06685 [Gammaproteobacteria bacterium]